MRADALARFLAADCGFSENASRPAGVRADNENTITTVVAPSRQGSWAYFTLIMTIPLVEKTHISRNAFLARRGEPVIATTSVIKPVITEIHPRKKNATSGCPWTWSTLASMQRAKNQRDAFLWPGCIAASWPPLSSSGYTKGDKERSALAPHLTKGGSRWKTQKRISHRKKERNRNELYPATDVAPPKRGRVCH